MRRFFIVRHGNTFGPGEAPRRVGARTDIPLVPSGEEQAQALGAWFAECGISFTRALASPLKRTRQTAEAILSASPASSPLEFADFLKEIDHGPDENASEAEVIARIGKDALTVWDRDASAPDGWIIDRESRIAAWQGFLTGKEEGTFLLVTSNGAARFALLAMGLDVAGTPLRLRTGALGEIVESEDGSLAIVQWDIRPSVDNL